MRFRAIGIGAAATTAAISFRLLSAYLNRRRLNKKLADRRSEHLENKERFAAKFGSVSERQREIVAMALEELRKGLQEGELKAAEVVEAFLAKAVEVDRRTNAVTEFLEDAVERARDLDAVPKARRGPLHGIPVSFKVRNRLPERVWGLILGKTDFDA